MFPESDKLEDLFLNEEIGARLAPYVTWRDGKPIMNRLMREQIDEIGRELYPEHAALFAAQKLRKKLRIAKKDEVDLEASEQFAALFGEQ
jgi:hypothetical protein